MSSSLPSLARGTTAGLVPYGHADKGTPNAKHRVEPFTYMSHKGQKEFMMLKLIVATRACRWYDDDGYIVPDDVDHSEHTFKLARCNTATKTKEHRAAALEGKILKRSMDDEFWNNKQYGRPAPYGTGKTRDKKPTGTLAEYYDWLVEFIKPTVSETERLAAESIMRKFAEFCDVSIFLYTLLEAFKKCKDVPEFYSYEAKKGVSIPKAQLVVDDIATQWRTIAARKVAIVSNIPATFVCQRWFVLPDEMDYLILALYGPPPLANGERGVATRGAGKKDTFPLEEYAMFHEGGIEYINRVFEKLNKYRNRMLKPEEYKIDPWVKTNGKFEYNILDRIQALKDTWSTTKGTGKAAPSAEKIQDPVNDETAPDATGRKNKGGATKAARAKKPKAKKTKAAADEMDVEVFTVEDDDEEVMAVEEGGPKDEEDDVEEDDEEEEEEEDDVEEDDVDDDDGEDQGGEDDDDEGDGGGDPDAGAEAAPNKDYDIFEIAQEEERKQKTLLAIPHQHMRHLGPEDAAEELQLKRPLATDEAVNTKKQKPDTPPVDEEDEEKSSKKKKTATEREATKREKEEAAKRDAEAEEEDDVEEDDEDTVQAKQASMREVPKQKKPTSTATTTTQPPPTLAVRTLPTKSQQTTMKRKIKRNIADYLDLKQKEIGKYLYLDEGFKDEVPEELRFQIARATTITSVYLANETNAELFATQQKAKAAIHGGAVTKSMKLEDRMLGETEAEKQSKAIASAALKEINKLNAPPPETFMEDEPTLYRIRTDYLKDAFFDRCGISVAKDKNAYVFALVTDVYDLQFFDPMKTETDVDGNPYEADAAFNTETSYELLLLPQKDGKPYLELRNTFGTPGFNYGPISINVQHKFLGAPNKEVVRVPFSWLKLIDNT